MEIADMLKVFLVEDEAPARRKLQRLVVECGAEVVGEAGSLAEALQKLPGAAADAVLLDIELGDGTAFDLLEACGGAIECALIFCTAYDAHALKAFEAEALDYLLKPIDPERLRRALSRVSPRGGYAKRLLVEHRRTLRFLPVENIDWIEADRNYVLVHSAAEEFTLRATLDSMERKLDPAHFARANRSAIVNINSVQRLERTESADLLAVLHGGAQVICSRKYWSQALEKLL
jgi:two-component system LytT family response regulator